MNGYNPAAIAKMLMEDHIKTGTGREEWRDASVRAILKNEKYMGDALLQKTYTADFLTKKVKRIMGKWSSLCKREPQKQSFQKRTMGSGTT